MVSKYTTTKKVLLILQKQTLIIRNIIIQLLNNCKYLLKGTIKYKNGNSYETFFPSVATGNSMGYCEFNSENITVSIRVTAKWLGAYPWNELTATTITSKTFTYQNPIRGIEIMATHVQSGASLLLTNEFEIVTIPIQLGSKITYWDSSDYKNDSQYFMGMKVKINNNQLIFQPECSENTNIPRAHDNTGNHFPQTISLTRRMTWVVFF